jgi:diamine N-acetyltransferase
MALTNGNITLRALEPDDVEQLYHWENDSRVWKVSNTHTPLSRYALANYIKTADRDIWESREMRLMIVAAENKPVGTVELFDFDPYHSRVGIGIMIFHDEDRRKGIATETFEMIADYALNELGLTQIYANIAQSNEASLSLFQKLGFEICGIKKHWLRRSKGWEDEVMLQKFL